MNTANRCNNPRSRDYANYGGRGIAVCERWQQFANFLADMGHRPEGMMLDRIDNNKGYEPSNTRWATRKQQNRNKRSNRLLTYRGETQCMVDWAERLGMTYTAMRKRLNRGWTIERLCEENNQ